MKNFTCLRMSLGLAAMVVSVGYLLLAGIASAQGPVTDAVINREIQNGQERAAMNALTGAPGASGSAPAAVQVALVIQVPPGYPIENFGYGQLQSEDASQNDLLLKLHALCQWKFTFPRIRQIRPLPRHLILIPVRALTQDTPTR